MTAVILNLLPIPGLDGFGMVEPYLPRSWGGAGQPGYAFLLPVTPKTAYGRTLDR